MSYTNIDLLEPLQGKDVGLILGVLHEGITLTGTIDDKNTKFTIDAKYLPLFDREADGTLDKDDITVYDDGVAVAVTSITHAFDKKTEDYTCDVELTAAPAAASKLTADVIQEKEPYIAQSLKVDAKYDEKTYGRLKSAVKKKSYGSREVTISLDLLFVDLEFTKIFFDTSTGEMLSEPPIVYAYIPLLDGDDEIGRLYFTQCRMIPKSVLDVKQGDQAGFSIELSVDTDPILWEAS